jgi:hypothetical protein
LGLQNYISVDTVWSRQKNGGHQIAHTGAIVDIDRKEKGGRENSSTVNGIYDAKRQK